MREFIDFIRDGHSARVAFDRVAGSRTAWRVAWLLFSILLALFGCGRVVAQSRHVASDARGEHIARLVCSACHVVAVNQEFPPILEPPAPSFAEIANRPGTTTKGVRRFVMTTHWDMKTIPMTMPDLMMMPEDATAVARYIVSLKTH